MVLLTNGGLPERPSIGQLPQDIQGTGKVTGQRDGVQARRLRRQGLLLVGREPAGDQDPLVRGWGRIVALEDLAPDPPFAQQLADWAEEVVLEAQQGVQALQDRPRGTRAVAVIAAEPPDEQAVALLHPGLVVLAVGPAAGEADAAMAAPPDEAGVDELTAVVTVPFAQGERQPRGDVLNGAGDPPLVQVPEGLQFGPTGGHVDRDERRAIPAGGRVPAVQDQTPLERAGWDGGPLAPRAQRHLGTEGGEGRREPMGLARAAPPEGPEQPIQGRGTGTDERRLDGRRDAQAMSCGQRRQQRGEDRAQQFARELVAGQPGRLEHRRQLVGHILHWAPGRPAPPTGVLTQPPDGGLPVTARGPAVLIKQASALLPIGVPIAGTYHRSVFPAGGLGHGGSFPVRGSVTPVLRQPLALR